MSHKICLLLKAVYARFNNDGYRYKKSPFKFWVVTVKWKNQLLDRFFQLKKPWKNPPAESLYLIRGPSDKPVLSKSHLCISSNNLIFFLLYTWKMKIPTYKSVHSYRVKSLKRGIVAVFSAEKTYREVVLSASKEPISNCR